MNKATLKNRLIERLEEILDEVDYPSADSLASEVLDVLTDEDLEVLDSIDDLITVEELMEEPDQDSWRRSV